MFVYIRIFQQPTTKSLKVNFSLILSDWGNINGKCLNLLQLCHVRKRRTVYVDARTCAAAVWRQHVLNKQTYVWTVWMQIKNCNWLEIKQGKRGQTHDMSMKRVSRGLCVCLCVCVCVCVCAAPFTKYTQVACCALCDVNEIMSIKAESLRTWDID